MQRSRFGQAAVRLTIIWEAKCFLVYWCQNLLELEVFSPLSGVFGARVVENSHGKVRHFPAWVRRAGELEKVK